MLNKISCIAISLSIFIAGCGSTIGTINHGEGNPKATASASDNREILPLLITLGMGLFFQLKKTESKSNSILLESKLIFETPDIETNNDDYYNFGYIVFLTKANGENKDRYLNFCRKIIDRMIIYQNDSNPSLSPEKYKGKKIGAVIWPLVKTSIIDKTDCHHLLDRYDDRISRIILKNYAFVNSQGPLLMAFNKRIKNDSHHDKEIHGIYFDMSEYLINDFDQLIDNWKYLISRPHNDWNDEIYFFAKKGRIVRTLRMFNSESLKKDGNQK